MTDAQLVTVAVSLSISFLAVFLGVLINNSRLNDVKELLRAEIRAQAVERRELAGRHHSKMMAKLVELDNRLFRLESQRLVR